MAHAFRKLSREHSYHVLDDFSQAFYKYRHELHGLFFKNHRLVISTELWNLIYKWLHASHLGIEKTLARAKMQFFWPRMTIIKEVVDSGITCNKFKRSDKKETVLQDSQSVMLFKKILQIYSSTVDMTG